MADVLIFRADGHREVRRSVHTPDYEGRADCVFTGHFDPARVTALPEGVANKHLVLDRGSVREMDDIEKAEVAVREQAAREAAVRAEMRRAAEERLDAR